MIDNIPTLTFVNIIKGDEPDKKINWIEAKSYFTCFIKRLYKEKERKADWQTIENLFTLNGKLIIPEDIKSNSGKVPDEIKEKINFAVTSLFH